MPLDGIFLSHVCSELQCACGSRIDKIFQPSRDELLLSLRNTGFAKKLLICVRPGSSRLQYTCDSFENPAVPPMFCMLLRKHLSGGKIVSITQDGFERVLTINILATDEMGERKNIKLITELIGNQSNIILVGADGKIIDSLRRSDIEKNTRLIQPGAVYKAPDMLKKTDPFDPSVKSLVLRNTESMLSNSILDTVAGVSPLVAREIEFSAAKTDIFINDMSEEQKTDFCSAYDGFQDYAKEGKPVMLCSQDGTPKDFSYMPITQYANKYTCRTFDSFSEMLDAFYSERDRLERLRRSTANIGKTLSNAAARIEKKLFLRREELKKCKDREKYRIFGELIKANIGLIEKGADFADVPNYYDENLANIRIALDPALSPAANASKYFKEYRKLCSAEQTLGFLISDCESEQTYIKSVQDALSRAQSILEIGEIRDELISAGYLKQQKGNTQKRKTSKPMEYISSDGFKILAGRNNLQNDALTLRTANKDDIWLHTKNIHGSHTVIICDGKAPPESTIIEAAQIAAYHSQARNSSQVPVDYTLVKNVKKPAGARPGMVIYKTNKTVFVTPKDI